MSLFVIPETTLADLASDIKRRLGIRTLRVVGDPAMRVTKLALKPGYPGFPAERHTLQRDDVEVLVMGEGLEWETIEYGADAAAEGRHKGADRSRPHSLRAGRHGGLRALAEELRHRSEGRIHRHGRAVLAGEVMVMRCLIFLTLGMVSALFAQVGEQRLAPGATLSETLAGGDQRVYRLQVPAGQVVEVSLHEVQGLAGILTVVGQDGNEVVSIDFAKRNPGAKKVLLGSGDFQLRLNPARHSSLQRIFQLSAGLPRPLGEPDQLRFSAEQAMGSGERILQTFQTNYLEDALARYEAALDLWKRMEDRPRQADAWNHIGFVLHFQGKMKAAIDAYQQCLDLEKAEHDDGGAAAALFGMAFIDYDTAQYAKGAELAAQALDLARAIKDWAGQSDALSVLGLTSMARGETDQARARYLAMLEAAQESGDPVREADAHNDLGLLEFQLANFVESEGHYSHALAIYRQENEPVRVAQELNNLGVMYSTSGDPRKALRYFEEALPIRKRLAQPGSYANTIYNAAVSYGAVGDFQQALDGYNAALPIFRRVAHRAGEAYTLEGREKPIAGSVRPPAPRNCSDRRWRSAAQFPTGAARSSR